MLKLRSGRRHPAYEAALCTYEAHLRCYEAGLRPYEDETGQESQRNAIRDCYEAGLRPYEDER